MRKARKRVAGPVKAALFPRMTQAREQTFQGAAGGSRLRLSSEKPNLIGQVNLTDKSDWTSSCLSGN